MNYLKRAEDILNETSWWFVSPDDKQRDKAIDLLNSAVIEFKLDKEYEQAGNCMKKIALLQYNNDYGKYNLAMSYTKAGQMYEFVDIKKAIDCYLYVIPLYIDLKKSEMVVTLAEKVANYYYDDNNFIDALKYYEMANTNNNHKLTLKIYDLYIRLHLFNKATKILDIIIHYYIHMKQDPSLFIFDLGILRIYANNPLICDLFLTKYNKYYSIEYQTLSILIECIKKGDKIQFITTQNNYHNTYTLKPWHIGLLDQVYLRL